MKIDMWYGNKISEVAFIDCWFSDCDCIYSGNLYNSNREMIGDYSTKDSTEIERQFGYNFG